MGLQFLWRDPESRRAVFLSITLHLLMVLGIAIWFTLPEAVPPEKLIVIDVGVPAQELSKADATQVDSPTKPTPSPQVGVPEEGMPPARTASEPHSTAPNPALDTDTNTLEAPPSPGPGVVESTSSEVVTVGSAGAVPVTLAPLESSPQLESQLDLPRENISTTTLPNIESEVLDVRLLGESINIPVPVVTVQVPEAQNVAPAPTVVVVAAEVLPEEALPVPELAVSVLDPIKVPDPEVRGGVTPVARIPAPNLTVTLQSEGLVPPPELAGSVAQDVSMPRPQVQADVTPTVVVPIPAVSTVVSEPVPLPLPEIEAVLTARERVPEPDLMASVTESQDVAIVPEVELTASSRVPLPSVRAEVSRETTEAGAPDVNSSLPEVNSVVENKWRELLQGGGNGPRSGQISYDPDAEAEGLGAIVRPDIGEVATGSRQSYSLIPDEEFHGRRLSVLLDNTYRGYPQSGLVEATQIIEIPVEGGLTRLMTVYDQSGPDQVGPIRSARDYFLNLANTMKVILVHDGGSPSALAAIALGNRENPTFNAQTSDKLFHRKSDRDAPYNLYSLGADLRGAIEELDLERLQLLSVLKYLPGEDAAAANRLDVHFSSDYTSAFEYLEVTNLYRWWRNGLRAVDATEKPVLVEAVLVGEIEVKRIPNDPEGRLYIPLNGGHRACLFLQGRKVRGNWFRQEGIGIQFVSYNGEQVDLRPFKTWVILKPIDTELTVR